jgi:hypothetical protein
MAGPLGKTGRFGVTQCSLCHPVGAGVCDAARDEQESHYRRIDLECLRHGQCLGSEPLRVGPTVQDLDICQRAKGGDCVNVRVQLKHGKCLR